MKLKQKLNNVQDFIPVKDIRYGIIETVDGRYIKLLEIEPINFMLRSEDEQFSIITSFASWLKISCCSTNGHCGYDHHERQDQQYYRCKLFHIVLL